MGKISETWFSLRSLAPSTSSDGQNVGIMAEPPDSTPSNSLWSFVSLFRFCLLHFSKIVLSLILVGLTIAVVALGNAQTDLRIQIAKNRLTSSQLRHVVKADEESLATYEANVDGEHRDLDEKLQQFSSQLEELKLESTAMKMALQFLTKQFNSSKEETMTMFSLMLKEANLTLCTEESGEDVTVPIGGVYKVQFSATITGSVVHSERVFSLQQNGLEIPGSILDSPLFMRS